ncbi:TetR/AcrR family transcriptional regulator [Miniphocaeibacter massiliensis]|uniref:TetR/AcrR family transcriptional regulator n=1 Tax=Miniphocaeibacter massiliensis TaxID=2041841 RepID=UPI000C08A160|nr:TetR/AcrR family transcriptional regulator [Miniphocaeibacter massiliensis]
MSYHKVDLKNKILKKSFELINLKGYQKVSTRMIARELSISPTAIYRHYKNYAELLKNVIYEGELLFSNYLLNNYNKNLSLTEQLFIMAKNYIDFSLDYPYLYDLMFISEYTPITSQNNMICDLETQGMKLLIDIIKETIENRSLNVSMETILTQLWAYIQGYSYLVRFHNFKINDMLIKHSIDSIWKEWC